jgi:YbbR domain-containing protein
MARITRGKRFVFTDLLYKIGALGLALFLWFYSISDNQFETNIDLPIEVRNIREGKALSLEVPLTATVRFRGTGRDLARLFLLKPFSDAKSVLDLQGISRRYVFHLDDYFHNNPERIVIPILGIREDLTFVEVVRPDSVLIELADYASRWVPVIPQVTVDIAPGFTQVGEMRVSPSEVLVEGGVEAVSKVREVRTMRRSYREVSEPLDIIVGLLHPDRPGSRLLGINTQNARIQVDVQMIGERRLQDMPVILRNVPSQLSVIVSPSSVDLTVVGGVDYLAELDSNDVEVFIDYRTQWSPTNLFVEPQVQLNKNILEFQDLVPKQLEIITTRTSP